MAGEVTYLRGRHLSQRAGGWVPEIQIPDHTWLAMFRALPRADRALTDPERMVIAEAVALHRHFIQTAADLRTPRQSQKRTLAAAARLPIAELANVFKNMDESTHMLVVTELYRAGARKYDELEHPPNAAIHDAAVTALANWKPAKGGHPTNAPRLFARAVLELWRELGGDPKAAISTWDSKPSPLVAFAVALFDVVVDQPLSDEYVRELMNSAREGFLT